MGTTCRAVECTMGVARAGRAYALLQAPHGSSSGARWRMPAT
jgi:hypothetical protein